jgi:branched-chain amino acid transport system ATP-binding protein
MKIGKIGFVEHFVTEMFGAIRRVNGEGTAVLLVEQNVARASRVAHRAYVLEEAAWWPTARRTN